MSSNKNRPLRVLLLADPNLLALFAPAIRNLGHVVTCELVVPGTETSAARSEADVAIVAIESGSPRALDFVQRIAAKATCPVIVCLAESEESFIGALAEAGVLPCVVGRRLETWQNVIEIVLRPYADYHHVLAGLRRRAVIERAKGILMERHEAREESAFELIRTEARSTNRRAVDVAQALLDGHPLLPNRGRRRAPLPQSGHLRRRLERA